MVDKRLLSVVPQAKTAIGKTVAAQFVGLIAGILFAYSLALVLAGMIAKSPINFALVIPCFAAALVLKFVSAKTAEHFSYMAARDVKLALRRKIYEKLLRLGTCASSHSSSAELIQTTVEGTEQLEIYFGKFLPQLMYAVVAPVSLFIVLLFVNVPSAIALLVFVPLIPATIMAIQQLAKRVMGKYWDTYTNLGDTFLENLQGLVTLKIYQADALRHEKMNEEAENFRLATMRVLRMQLNSIIVMDIVALGGAVAGMSVGLYQMVTGALDVFGFLFIVLVSADFFIPMRTLGSYFHVAMNGMSASDKIFTFLNESEQQRGTARVEGEPVIEFRDVTFAYPSVSPDEEAADDGVVAASGAGTDAPPSSDDTNVSPSSTQTGAPLSSGTETGAPSAESTPSAASASSRASAPVLRNITITLPAQGMCAVVGLSGSGKSSLAHLIAGEYLNFTGSLTIGSIPVQQLSLQALSDTITTVPTGDYVFSGTLRSMLCMARPHATDAELWDALDKANIASFVKNAGGLDMPIEAQGLNVSGGQRQRLCLARALLHNTPYYIFDEATSNIDVESEEHINAAIERLAREKGVLVISHRLANVVHAQRIFVLHEGALVGWGTHEELLATCDMYRSLWNQQSALENIRKGEVQ